MLGIQKEKVAAREQEILVTAELQPEERTTQVVEVVTLLVQVAPPAEVVRQAGFGSHILE